MLKYSIIEVEKKLGKTIKRNVKCLGVDTASRSGYAIIVTDDKDITLDYGFIDIKSKDRIFKFNQMIDIFMQLVKGCNIVIVEDVFLKFNVMVHSFLSRIGMIVYMSAFLNKVAEKEFVWATTARKGIGLIGNAKKEVVQNEFKTKLNINIDDNDIVDAVVLALYGIVEKELTKDTFLEKEVEVNTKAKTKLKSKSKKKSKLK